MLKILGIVIIAGIFSSCEGPCVECTYNGFKGAVTKEYCSSLKTDRDEFILDMDSLAEKENSISQCTYKNY